MTEMDNHDDARFDRLVDGQLPPGEYRALLASLDDEPGGWRRCALAILEAQALRAARGAWREKKTAVSVAKDIAAPADALGRRPLGWARMVLAMAACFLVAFGLGMLLRSQWPAAGSQDGFVAEENSGNPGTEQENPQDQPPGGNHYTILHNEPDVGTDISQQPLRNVTLVVGDDEAQAERFELPVVYYGDVGDEYFNTEHSAMTDEMREMLRQSGHRLRRTQRMVPLRMDDGQQVVVPVEELEIVPVGLPAF